MVDKDLSLIAIDIGGTNMRGVVINSGCQFTKRMKYRTDKTSSEAIIQQILVLIGCLRQQTCDGIVGISIAGSVDHKKGILIDPPSRINLRDSNPVRGEMFIETGTTKHISSSVGAIREIAFRNTCRAYGAWWICGLSYAINISLVTEFQT